ncbi:MAG: diaminopimelate epimerase [Nitrospinota bacterium]|nr:MAG: diaminopimelate epimerase [Nitrospinota bacterium]
MRFVKMHGIGNDYIYIDCFQQEVKAPEKLAPRMSDRHFGVGGDGLILIMPSQRADLRMRMFNADGSEAEMCGNGIRCVAKYAYDHHLVRKEEISVETLAGILHLQLFPRAGKVERVRVNMGVPRLLGKEIPVQKGGEEPIIDQPLTVQEREFRITCVSMGNPHCVIFVGDTETFPVTGYGPQIEHHPFFPQRTNVEFVQVLSADAIRMRTWERGSGETLACGTGACAATVASILNGKTGPRITVHLRGGDLELEWGGEGEPVFMTGPATEVFSGEWPEEETGEER